MVYVLIIVAIFLLDLFVKNKIEKNVMENEKKPIFNDKIIVQKYHNKGAFLNFGEKKQKVVAFISLLLCLIMGIVFVLSLGKSGSHCLKLGLAFLLGGAFSNTFDRLKRKYVVDYVSFHIGLERLTHIIFNISDFFIMIGAVLMVIGGFDK